MDAFKGVKRPSSQTTTIKPISEKKSEHAVAEGGETEKQILARKLYMMRKMLKNEKRANEIINQKLSNAIGEAHGVSATGKAVEAKLKGSK